MKYLLVSTVLLYTIQVCFAAYGYNITVSLYPDGAKPTTGKMSVFLNGPGFKHEVLLQPHMTPIHNGFAYSFYTEAPYAVNQITDTTFLWRRKILGNSGPKILPVMKVIVEPSYIANPTQRRAWTRCFGGSPALWTVVKADKKTPFASPCMH